MFYPEGEEMQLKRVPLVDIEGMPEAPKPDDTPILPAVDGPLPEPPPGFVRDLSPPLSLQEKLKNPEKYTLCGGRFLVQFQSGPWRGRQIPTYCAEPLCIDTGSCTGPRFVPTLDQAKMKRKPTMEQVVAAVRESARKATGKDDPRTDKEIVAHVRKVTRRGLAAVNRGQWVRR